MPCHIITECVTYQIPDHPKTQAQCSRDNLGSKQSSPNTGYNATLNPIKLTPCTSQTASVIACDPPDLAARAHHQAATIATSTPHHPLPLLSKHNNNSLVLLQSKLKSKAIHTLTMYNMITLLLQALLFAPAFAAPMSDPTFTVQDNAWKFGTGGGIIGLIVLVLDIIVFCTLALSSSTLYAFHLLLASHLIFYVVHRRGNECNASR